MQDSERPKFEEKFKESWKKAFDGAESTPPDHVWNAIELDLASQESAAMKKKVVFYQRLAAAMLIFGLIAGSYGYYNGVKSEGRNEKGLAQQKEQNKKQIPTRNPSQTQKPVGEPLQNHTSQLAFTKPIEFVPEPEEEQVAIAIVEENKVENKVEQNDEEKEEERSEAEVVASLLQQLEGPETVVEPNRSKHQRENLWLALGGSAGNYTPNTPTATTPTISQASFASKGPALSFATTSVPKAQPKVGSSYSVGVGIGKRFGRFVVQTGVNLNKQQINYVSNYDAHTTSNTAVAAMSDYIGQNAALTITNEYTVSSTMDIVSIPVQLGYMIVDRRLGWQINGGVSNDFFLRNVLVDKSGQRSKFTQESGSESPYRSVNWSALASTELSYRIGRHYRISLVPGARYSFNSILKNTKDTGRPVVLDVGFRFRYIFE